MRKPRPTARAIIIQNEKIALLERYRQGKHYFVFPGGGIDPGETPEQAAIREAREETGLEIAIERLVAEINYQNSPQFFFLAHPIGGAIGTGDGPEFTEPPSEKNGTYSPGWFSLRRIPDLSVLPNSIATLTTQHPNWPETVLHFDES